MIHNSMSGLGFPQLINKLILGKNKNAKKVGTSTNLSESRGWRRGGQAR